ncbi:MAG TPA: hypothetical protein VII52_11610 [Gemmatimonadaceae bacterium]
MAEESIVVTVDDGTSFVCHREVIQESGDFTPPSVPSPYYRWIVTASNGVARIGPPVLKDSSPPALQRLINEWYRIKKRLGQWK